MKSKLFTTLLLLVTISTFAQDKTIFLDSLNHETLEGKHTHYRIVKGYFSDSKALYRIQEYYPNGKIKTIGNSKSKDFLEPEGQFVDYYKSGEKKAAKYYKDSTPNGPYTEFYENGNPKLEGEYIPTGQRFKSKLKILEFWNAKNVLTATGGNGDYEEVDEFQDSSGKIKDGYKDGVWTGFDCKIKYSYTETYANQELVSGVSIDSNKVERTYKIVEAVAAPKSGIEGFYMYIAKNFKVPEVENLKGKILTTFDVGIDGKLSNAKVIRSIGHGTDAEVLRVLRSYTERWNAKEIRGIKLKMVYTFPINIQSSE